MSSPRGFTVWFTGPPGSGKTTLARALTHVLRQRGLERIELLDGDDLRTSLSRDLGFGREDRDENVRRTAFLCEMLNRHGVIALVALVSPYERAREEARGRLRMALVHVGCPLDVLVARDAKGLYRRALAGELTSMTGIDDPYETPTAPDLRVRTDRETTDGSVARVVRMLEDRGLLDAA